jgi:hypothetical protein
MSEPGDFQHGMKSTSEAIVPEAVIMGGHDHPPLSSCASFLAWAAEPVAPRPVEYAGWSTIVRRRNGEILLVYSGGREGHVCPFGRVELMRSRDEGRTWSWPQVLMDSPVDDRDAGVCETARGTLLVTTFTSLAYETLLEKAELWPVERRERWMAVQRRLPESGGRAWLGEWMLRSEDGGRTWSAPYRVPLNSPHGPVLLRDGRLLYAGRQLWDPAARVGVCESSDDGRTWQWLAGIPVRPGDDHREYHELHLAATPSGRLIVHIRNHNPRNRNETLQSESDDGGKTWTAPHPIGVWGLPSHLLLLRDGRLLMSYGYRREPFGNQARVSADQGDTWSEPVPISADGANGDLGYPSSVELDSGELFTVWYEKPAGQSQALLRQQRWRLPG